MALSPENVSMALFCDFENVALGVRDANYDKFDIKRVLERLLLKGSIVVKKAYCDWERYKGFKATMHEANFELIEIPHVRQSGKNSADIRLVVDALDLCYTKSHVNTFVIISGDSDFSPLVSKLRENAKYVIGVGVKQSTSDLLIANCDEFIFYDDLVRDSQREAARRDAKSGQQQPKRSPEDERRYREEKEKRKQQAMDLAVETFDALVAERGDSGKIWASVLKEAIKRRKPDFNESYYGFRAFGNLIEEAQARGLLEFGRDEKSGAYVFRSSNSTPAPRREPEAERAAPRPAAATAAAPTPAPVPEAETETATGRPGGRRQGRGKRAASATAGTGAGASTGATAGAAAGTAVGSVAGSTAAYTAAPTDVFTGTSAAAAGATSVTHARSERRPTPPAAVTVPTATDETRASPPAATIPGGRRQGRNSQAATAKTAGKAASAAAPQSIAPQASAPTPSRPAENTVAAPANAMAEAGQPATEAKPRKAAPRSRRPRKADTGPAGE